MDESQFPGIMFEDITEIEKCFNIKILIYNLNLNGAVTCVYETMCQNSSKMYLNVYHNHYSYITYFSSMPRNFNVKKALKFLRRYAI